MAMSEQPTETRIPQWGITANDDIRGFLEHQAKLRRSRQKEKPTIPDNTNDTVMPHPQADQQNQQ